LRTFVAKPGEIPRKWFVVDANGQVLGRLASKVATVLRGKHRPTFTPHVDAGDFVVVINAEKIKMTGEKLTKKLYHRWSGYPGGFRSEAARLVLEKKPDFIIRKAVWGMLPKNVLGRQLLTKLKVYSGTKHPHEAQKPEPLAL
jgi:large subunit ribosomal protein L13